MTLDFLTITSKDQELLNWFENLINSKFDDCFKEEDQLRWGQSYIGHSYFFEQTRTNKAFLGYRFKTEDELEDQLEALVTIPGYYSDFFLNDVFTKQEILTGKWRITRLDIQLTLDCDLFQEKEMTDYRQSVLEEYRELSEKQRYLEANQGKGREVDLTEKPPKYVVVGIGSSQSRRNRVAIYSSLTEKARLIGNPFVRLEVRLGNTDNFIQLINENGFPYAMYNVVKSQLGNLCRLFFKNIEII